MKKAKPKSKSHTKTKVGSRRTGGTAKKSLCRKENANPLEMRREITNVVGGELEEILQAIVSDARNGQLPTVKYLFEVAGVHPQASDEGSEKVEEDSLAQRLIRILGLPDGPLPSEDEEETVTNETKVADSDQADQRILASERNGNEDQSHSGNANAGEGDDHPVGG